MLIAASFPVCCSRYTNYMKNHCFFKYNMLYYHMYHHSSARRGGNVPSSYR